VGKEPLTEPLPSRPLTRGAKYDIIRYNQKGGITMRDTVYVTRNKWFDKHVQVEEGTKNLGAEMVRLDGVTYKLAGTGDYNEYRKTWMEAVYRPLTMYTYLEIPQENGTVELEKPTTYWFYEIESVEETD